MCAAYIATVLKTYSKILKESVPSVVNRAREQRIDRSVDAAQRGRTVTLN